MPKCWELALCTTLSSLPPMSAPSYVSFSNGSFRLVKFTDRNFERPVCYSSTNSFSGGSGTEPPGQPRPRTIYQASPAETSRVQGPFCQPEPRHRHFYQLHVLQQGKQSRHQPHTLLNSGMQYKHRAVSNLGGCIHIFKSFQQW